MLPARSVRVATATLLLLAFAGSALAESTDLSRSSAAYDRIQRLRDEARALVSNGTDPERIRQGLGKLDEALAWAHTPEIRELATGNRYLYARDYDVLRDMAEYNALLGNKDQALRLLERMNEEAWVPAVERNLRGARGFASLQEEPRFKAVLATLAATERLFKVPAIATPYRERLGLEERIAGLSLFWSEARQHFVHFDKVPGLEWDRAYLDFLPKVSAAETTQDYYQVMRRFAALLQDGHSNVYAPKELAGRVYARPPIRTDLVEGRVLVTAVRSASLGARIAIGDEVIAIDGMPVADYARERVAPFVSSSTPQDRELRTYAYELLLGDEGRPVTLRLRNAAGRERDESLARGGYSDVKHPPGFEFRKLPGDIAYLSIDHFQANDGVKALEKALPDILAARGLVLDLRQNGGGSSSHGLDILGYLTAERVPLGRSRHRGETGLDRARRGGAGVVAWRPEAGDGESGWTPPQHERRFIGPVAVLIGSQTFSAAEDFAMYVVNAKRGILVGGPTGGSTGQPLSFAMPGGGSARICVKRDTFPDGRTFVGKGILPDVAAATTVEAIRAGRDPVLEAAVAALAGRR